MTRSRGLLAAAAIGTIWILALAQSNPALAKSSLSVVYDYDAVWSTAIRAIRVDHGFEITDKDKANGYLLFVYPGQGAVKKCRASLELIRSGGGKAARPRVELQLSIQQQPSYIEVDFLERIERKLREDYGPPRDQSGADEAPAPPAEGPPGQPGKPGPDKPTAG